MATYESRRYNTPVPDASKIADGSVNNTEFEHLDGVTSDIQTQFTGKLPIAGGVMVGNLGFEDAVRARFGTGGDLEIKHDGSNGNIANSTGQLTVNADTVQFKNLADNSTFLTLNSSSSFTSLADVYPVGSIYMNATNNANPNSLFGFGTWVDLGAGRMPINVGGGFTAGDTGGSTTHTLSEAQLPEHKHFLFANYSMNGNQFADWARINNVDTGNGKNDSAAVEYYQASGSDDFKYRMAFDRINAEPSVYKSGKIGSGSSVDHMNPYIVVYMWKRTA